MTGTGQAELDPAGLRPQYPAPALKRCRCYRRSFKSELHKADSGQLFGDPPPGHRTHSSDASLGRFQRYCPRRQTWNLGRHPFLRSWITAMRGVTAACSCGAACPGGPGNHTWSRSAQCSYPPRMLPMPCQSRPNLAEFAPMSISRVGRLCTFAPNLADSGPALSECAPGAMVACVEGARRSCGSPAGSEPSAPASQKAAPVPLQAFAQTRAPLSGGSFEGLPRELSALNPSNFGGPVAPLLRDVSPSSAPRVGPECPRWVAIWCAATGAKLRMLGEASSRALDLANGFKAFAHGARLVTFSSTRMTVWNASSGERPLCVCVCASGGGGRGSASLAATRPVAVFIEMHTNSHDREICASSFPPSLFSPSLVPVYLVLLRLLAPGPLLLGSVAKMPNGKEGPI